ncbi:DUF4190 domain-containing protein [Humisphaera borealis]|uniref:DUF4190 domain-containing protein n=1 Tax=Humisphaera borealis TaxID=2807512 RepID=A0A7M2WZU5_9BACT|nr:DUF4190 domain-containing protein [Humisphaera borealis]QOV90923.1 DUF4190 domain-containing protein [Humisphaera borealis]
MTNYPPPQGQPPYGQPPYGQPPAAYGQPAPYGQPGMVMAPQASNGWSIAALVTGIISFCVPLLGGLLALLFGFLGIKRSKVTNSGKGMSIAGLILGVLSVGLWALFGSAIWAMVQGTAVNRDIAKQFINDLASQNLTNAATVVDGKVIDSKDLQKLADVVKPMGTIQDITTFGIQANTGSAGSEVVVAGAITFVGGGTKSFEMRQTKQGDKWVIVYVEIK